MQGRGGGVLTDFLGGDMLPKPSKTDPIISDPKPHSNFLSPSTEFQIKLQ